MSLWCCEDCRVLLINILRDTFCLCFCICFGLFGGLDLRVTRMYLQSLKILILKSYK